MSGHYLDLELTQRVYEEMTRIYREWKLTDPKAHEYRFYLAPRLADWIRENFEPKKTARPKRKPLANGMV